MADAMMKTHGRAGLFERTAEFPTLADPEFPMAPAANDYYRNGPSFLNRYIPFWITNSAQRLIAVLIALFGVILPILTYAPKVHDWWFNRRFQAWYTKLHDLEFSLGPQLGSAQMDEIKSALTDIEDDVRRAKIPDSLTVRSFSLRGHIDMVRRKMAEIERAKES